MTKVTSMEICIMDFMKPKIPMDYKGVASNLLFVLQMKIVLSLRGFDVCSQIITKLPTVHVKFALG